MVTVKIHATAKARDEGLFDKIAEHYKGASKVIEENITPSNSRVKAPVLHITIPFEKVSELLQITNQFEDTIKRLY